MVFFSLVGILFALGGGGVWLYWNKANYTIDSDYYKYNLYGAYVLWGIDGTYLLLLLCLCNRIRLGVSIIKCTAQFIANTPTVFIVPVLFSVICAVWIAAWSVTALFLFSVGSLEPRDSPL
jgi:hypothetical protein